MYFVLTASHENTTESDNDSEGSASSVEKLFESLYNFLCSSLALYMQHTYASHVVRVVFEVLAGQPVSESIVRSRLSRHQQQARSKQAGVLSSTIWLILCNGYVCLQELGFKAVIMEPPILYGSS